MQEQAWMVDAVPPSTLDVAQNMNGDSDSIMTIPLVLIVRC